MTQWGSFTPKEALNSASRNLIDLFIPFLHAEEENFHFQNNKQKVTLPLPYPLFTLNEKLAKLRKTK